MRVRLARSAAARFLLATYTVVGASAASAEPHPRLVVFLAIDQGRAEYLERFRPALEGGLRLLLERGLVFTETHHAHAITVTAPGHASLSTGRYPAHTGIVGNEWFERGENREVYCVEDREFPVLPVLGRESRWADVLGRSPRRLRGTALGDWMKKKVGDSRVYSVAGKDRSSVLMGGKEADGAFWFDGETGQWVTSRYYMKEYPAWVREFHARRVADGYFGRTWEPLPVADALLAAMNVEASRAGAGAKDSGIPKVIGRGSLAEDSGFYHVFFETPFLESHLLAFAESLVRAERLGADEVPDLLALGFSSIDSVGHDYGPNSRELLDAILRLDRELGAFFRFLDETVGLFRVGFALSADHGVAGLPEYQVRHGLPGGRVSTADMACIAGAEKTGWFMAPLQFDEKALRREKLTRSAAEALVAEDIARCPGVARVWTRTEIERVNEAEWPTPDPTLLQFARSYFPGRSPDLFVQFAEGLIEDRMGTTHGSPFRYDSHVPGIVVWPGIEPRSIGDRVATVDLPVTIASLLGLRTPVDVDGLDRSDLMR
jgi:hypothetical protein